MNKTKMVQLLFYKIAPFYNCVSLFTALQTI